MKTLLLLLFSVLLLFAADPAQPKVGVTPVLNATNGFGGILTIRTQINVGYTGQAGFIEMRSDEPTNYGAIYLSPSNWVFSVNATDEYDGGAFTLVVTNEIQQADILQMYNGTNLKVYIQYDGSILGHRLFAEDAPFSDNYTRIQPTNTKINIGVNTNYISLDAATGIIEMFHEGTNTFRVNQNSGYNGQADWFLAADGDYHQSSGGGGDSLWTNNAGLIELIGSTDIILNPAVADGASAVAFSLNSSNALSTSGAKLLTVGNGGTNIYTFSNHGTAIFGSDQSLYLIGRSDNAEVYGEAGPYDFDLLVTPTLAYFELATLTFEPTAADGTTPYTFDTSLAHTSGNLAEFKNNGTNHIDFLAGQYGLNFGPGGTNVLYRSGTDMLYTNGNTQPFFKVVNGSGATASIGLNGGGNMLIDSSGGAIFLGDQLNSLSIVPASDNTYVSGQVGGNRWSSVASYGFASVATDSAVTIASTGWTNTFGKNATVYMDSLAGITFTVYNNAGTSVFTNSTVAASMSTVLLQPSGKVIITGGTLGVGRAVPF